MIHYDSTTCSDKDFEKHIFLILCPIFMYNLFTDKIEKWCHKLCHMSKRGHVLVKCFQNEKKVTARPAVFECMFLVTLIENSNPYGR